jgi:hypothetical protein
MRTFAYRPLGGNLPNLVTYTYLPQPGTDANKPIPRIYPGFSPSIPLVLIMYKCETEEHCLQRKQSKYLFFHSRYGTGPPGWHFCAARSNTAHLPSPQGNTDDPLGSYSMLPPYVLASARDADSRSLVLLRLFGCAQRCLGDLPHWRQLSWTLHQRIVYSGGFFVYHYSLSTDVAL